MLGFYGDVYGGGYQWEIVPPDDGGGGNGYHLPPSGYFPDSEPGPTPGPTPTTEGPPPGGPTPYDPGPGSGNGGPSVAPATGPSTALYLVALGVAALLLVGGRRR